MELDKYPTPLLIKCVKCHEMKNPGLEKCRRLTNNPVGQNSWICEACDKRAGKKKQGGK